MPEESAAVKIRVKLGETEAEVETSMSNVREAIGLVPELLEKLPHVAPGRRSPSPATTAPAELAPASLHSHPLEAVDPAPQRAVATSVPAVSIEKGDSLSDVISKFFADPWGRSPRRLLDVREALQSYGLNYPKQSVAVALLRLAKGSKIRRFKAEAGEYVYTATTGATRAPTVAPQQAPPLVPAGEPQVPAQEDAAPQAEEQLDLDVPSSA